MKILLIVSLFAQPGGLATATKRIARAFEASGDDVLILTRDHENPTNATFGRSERRRVDGLAIHYLPDSWLRAEGYGLGCMETLRVSEEFDPDIVHAYFAVPSAYFGAVVARRRNIPLVVSCRGNDITQHMVLRPSTVRLALESANHVTAVSDSLLKWGEIVATYQGSSPVYNSIEPEFVPAVLPVVQTLRERFGLSSDATILGTNAVFGWKKNPAYLQALLAHLVASDLEKLEFVLVGKYDDLLENGLARIFDKSHGLKSRRLITAPLPTRKDLPHLLGSLDLFVHTSRREGMPNVLLEAMSLGIPVAATAVNGCVDLLREPPAGLLLNPFDPEQGARQILELLADHSRRQDYADVGRKLMVTRHSVAQEMRSLKQIYRRLMESKDPRLNSASR